MTVIISYDIPDDRTRHRIAGYQEGKGVRVQKSVFECVLSVEDMKNIALKLKELIDEDGDIRLYHYVVHVMARHCRLVCLWIRFPRIIQIWKGKVPVKDILLTVSG